MEDSGAPVLPAPPIAAETAVLLGHLADEVEALARLLDEQDLLSGGDAAPADELVDAILGLRAAVAYLRELAALIRRGVALTADRLARLCDLLEAALEPLGIARIGIGRLGWLAPALLGVLLAHLSAIVELLEALGLTCWLARHGRDLPAEIRRALEPAREPPRRKARHYKL